MKKIKIQEWKGKSEKKKKITQCETISWVETENNINVVCERENETKEYINEFFLSTEYCGLSER